MAKSFEGLSRTDPRGLEPAGRERELPGEPLLIEGGQGRPRTVAAAEPLPEVVSSSLHVSVAALGGDSAPFLFHSQEMADGGQEVGAETGVGGGLWLSMGSSARDTKPQSNETSWWNFRPQGR